MLAFAGERSSGGALPCNDSAFQALNAGQAGVGQAVDRALIRSGEGRQALKVAGRRHYDGMTPAAQNHFLQVLPPVAG